MTGAAMKGGLAPLAICADDYAISPAVSAGIRQLAEAGRLTATGVMANMPSWPAEAGALRDLSDGLAVGLHLTLTDQAPLGRLARMAPRGRLPAIGSLFRQSFAGQLPRAEVADEVNRQLDRFEQYFGRSPDFVDGHQHAHLLPGIREVVLALFDRRLDRQQCWLRDCTDGPTALLRRGNAVKAGIIALVGTPLSRAARQRGIRTNHGFSGFYAPGRQSFERAVAAMLAAPGRRHLLMVHPGHVDEDLRLCDSLTGPREAEWAFLMAHDTPERLADLGFSIASRGFPD